MSTTSRQSTYGGPMATHEHLNKEESLKHLVEQNGYPSDYTVPFCLFSNIVQLLFTF